MARALDEGFADIIALARARLTQVRVEEDVDADRAILIVEGQLDQYRILIKETVNSGRFLYELDDLLISLLPDA